ncbi:MAG TPA: tetratricopeptide repeat-containing sensor histidine kinase [Puia sp.]|nr:tetratricopeptide repeat-containing sensor histidine kinase [Puia sp.]
MSINCRHQSSLPPDHPVFFDRVYHQLDSLRLPPQQSFHFLDSIYSRFPSPGPLDLVRRYDYKGYYYFYQAHDLKSSMRYVDSSLSLLSSPSARVRYPQQYAKALLDKGEIFQYQKNYEDALFYYYKGRQAIDQLNDSCTMAEYTQRLAMASFRQTRYSDARQFFEQALHEYAACGADFGAFAYQQSNLDNIGECYAALKKWDSAGFYYDSTLSFITRAARPYLNDSAHVTYIETARAVVLGNQGDCLLYQRDTAKAREYYRKSIDIDFLPRHDSDNAVIVLVKLAGLDLAQGQLAQAHADLQRARIALDRRPALDVELTWQKLQTEWYDRSGDLSGAYRSLTHWTHTRDSLNSLQEPFSTINFPSSLQHLEDQYTIQLLQQRDYTKTAWLLLTVLLVVLLTVILFLIRRNARRSREYIRQLNQANQSLRNENQQTQLAINSLNESQASYLQTLKIVAHDLRSPVGAISSATSILEQQVEDGSEIKPWLELIRKAADQSLKLVGEIMRLDIPLGSMKKEPVDLALLLETCIGTLQFRAREKNQAIRLETQSIVLMIDQEKIWRVIINLVDNAIKFSPDDSVIYVRSFRDGDNAIITVTDKGIGIPRHLEARLFTIDNQAKRTGTAGEGSFGLGLVIVKQIIQAHGGAITIESREGEGTSFRIELPITTD